MNAGFLHFATLYKSKVFMVNLTSRTVPDDELAVLSVHRNRAGKPTGIQEFIHIGKPGIPATGEIIPAEELQVPHLNTAALQTDRQKVIKSLRPEVREFFSFVLLFRNNRRGITPGIKTLCQWFAQLTGKRTDNVRRYVAKLREAEVLVDDDAVGPLWQKTGAKPKDVFAEICVARNRFMFVACRRFDAKAMAAVAE